MRIFIYKQGIPVSFRNYPTQHDYETVIGLHNNNTVIEDFTFKAVVYDKNKLDNLLSRTPVETIAYGYLFYSFKYQVSFHHFMASTAPMIKDYIDKYPTYKLLVPEHCYNALCKDICNLFSVTDDRIIILRDKHLYQVMNLATRTWDDDVFNLSASIMDTFRHLRDTVGTSTSVPKIRRIYIQRDRSGNEAFNNSNTGTYRAIVNEDVLIAKLKEVGFEIVTLGTRTMREKKELLEGAKTIVTPLGANCLNLLFSTPERVVFLSNASGLGSVFYTDLVRVFNQCSVETLKFNNIRDKCDPHNQWNSPFEVDVDAILRTI